MSTFLNYPIYMKTKKTVKTLSENLRHLMEVSDMTITELVRRSGVSRRTIAYILNAENATSIENAELLAKPFGLEGWHLIMPNLPNDIRQSSELKKLINNYLSCPDEGKEMIGMVAEREAKYKSG